MCVGIVQTYERQDGVDFSVHIAFAPPSRRVRTAGTKQMKRNPDPQRRFIPTLMMSAVLHPGGVGCKLVHIFHTEVKGEHHDGRSEAREGILPQVVEERVSSPRVLSSEYHGDCIYSIVQYANANSIQSERRQEITQNKQPEEEQMQREEGREHGERREKLFIVPGTSYKNDQPFDRRRYGLRLVLIGRTRQPNHHLHPPISACGMH